MSKYCTFYSRKNSWLQIAVWSCYSQPHNVPSKS